MNNLLALLAYLILVGFLGILLLHVPRLDLMGVVVATLLLAGWDLYKGLRSNKE